MRNETTKDGTHMPIKDENKNFNISINGGTWEESYRERIGYGNSGMYDKNRSFYGVSTFMFFNNMKNLTLKRKISYNYQVEFAFLPIQKW